MWGGPYTCAWLQIIQQFGFAFQFSQSDTDVGTSGTGIDSKNYNLSVYRTRPLNDDNFIEGLLGIGSIDSELLRKSGSNTLTASRDGTQIFGSINYGKTFSKKDFSLTPIGRIDLGYTELDAYTEIGTDALSYDKQNVESGLASLGLEINDIIFSWLSKLVSMYTIAKTKTNNEIKKVFLE